MSQHDAPIIRKKRSEGEEDHHGGVWKLAFADFMTAMMAFFLVMWLINSTTKETKAVIVQYFNPVQLVDSTASHKGLRDPKKAGEGKSAQPSKPVDTEGGPKDKDAALQSEPLKTLEEIAKNDPPPTAVDPAAAQSASAPIDPFDRRTKSPPPLQNNGAASEQTPPSRDKNANALSGPASEKTKSAAQLQKEIERIASQEAHAPKIEVKETEGGLLISLTDDANFTMFNVGSIEPKPQLVRIIGQVGKILAGRPGDVELRGHTDGRQYSGKNYDNWRLSSDRATMVNYMLIRGGLPPARVGKVVGLADRQLKNPKDPMAPVNRRIDILLHGAGQ